MARGAKGRARSATTDESIGALEVRAVKTDTGWCMLVAGIGTATCAGIGDAETSVRELLRSHEHPHADTVPLTWVATLGRPRVLFHEEPPTAG